MKKISTYVKSINATLRNYRGRNMYNAEKTLINRGKRLGLEPKIDKKGNVYFSESKVSLKKYENISGIFERISGLAEKSKITNLKKKIKKEIPPDLDVDEAIKMSEELTTFIEENKYSLYALDTGINDASALLNEMDSGHLDLVTAYNAMQKIKKDDEFLKNNSILLNRKSKFKLTRL